MIYNICNRIRKHEVTVATCVAPLSSSSKSEKACVLNRLWNLSLFQVVLSVFNKE
ncbi:hypothetical protein M514_21879 [Trichuris suis]|uniref:Uncharacterized protein n=1 Tax=Trichuris suis TaxID=68888 RepID=A0A085N8X0_9BILA|nr:hypothetical protein M514_21879 [Trichuris suis]